MLSASITSCSSSWLLPLSLLVSLAAIVKRLSTQLANAGWTVKACELTGKSSYEVSVSGEGSALFANNALLWSRRFYGSSRSPCGFC